MLLSTRFLAVRAKRVRHPKDRSSGRDDSKDNIPRNHLCDKDPEQGHASDLGSLGLKVTLSGGFMVILSQIISVVHDFSKSLNTYC